ncbi:MAG: sulfatase [Deltaproteobacteria bacterium]
MNRVLYPVPRGGRRLPRPLLALLVIALLVGGLSCTHSEPTHSEPTPEAAGRRLIFIMLDAARPDRFSSYGYERETTPVMDELARRGMLFENHYAQSSFTRASLPSLLFSRYFTKPLEKLASSPRAISLPIEVFHAPVDDAAISFPRALDDAGFRVTALSATIWLQAGVRFASEFPELRNLSAEVEFPVERGYPNAAQVVDEAIAWLDENSSPDFALYLHFMDTHFPHFLDADAREYFGDAEPPDTFGPVGRPTDFFREATAFEHRYLDALYDGSLRYADREIGRLIEYLRARDELDDTLIVVTADHGENLWETPGRLEHRGPWFEEVARIPLLVFYPGRVEPGRTQALTSNIDIAPTILELLEVPFPPGKMPDGRSLVDPRVRADMTRPVFGPDGSMRGPRYKILFKQPDRELLGRKTPDVATLQGMLFDLQEDPAETKNLFAEKPEVVRRLLAAYREKMTPGFDRHQQARLQKVPEEAFAIGAASFRTSRDIERVAPQAAPGVAGFNDWLRYGKGRGTQLLAGADAEPLEIHFPMPDGRYHVSAVVLGDLMIEAGGHTLNTAGRALEMDTKINSMQELVGEVLALGVIEVRGRSFQARIRGGAGPSTLRSFEFVPTGLDAAPQALSVAEALMERLRVLGYVE